MASLHQLAFCLSLTICLAAAASVRVKRQIRPQGFNCPQANGTFTFRDDCSKFYQCTNELATLMDCSVPLLFDSRSGTCGWPNEVVQNGDCTPPARQDNEHDMCAQQPAVDDLRPGQAWYVAHPTICNAFYHCGTGWLYAPCTMCPETMYYDANLMACQPMYDNPPENFCNGLQFIPFEDHELTRLSGVCWPFANIPNPMQAQADKVIAERNGGGNNGRWTTNNNNNWNRGINTNTLNNRGIDARQFQPNTRLNTQFPTNARLNTFQGGNQGSENTFGTPGTFFPYGQGARRWN